MARCKELMRYPKLKLHRSVGNARPFVYFIAIVAVYESISRRLGERGGFFCLGAQPYCTARPRARVFLQMLSFSWICARMHV